MHFCIMKINSCSVYTAKLVRQAFVKLLPDCIQTSITYHTKNAATANALQLEAARSHVSRSPLY